MICIRPLKRTINMKLNESFIDEIMFAFKKKFGPKWRKYYNRIFDNTILSSYIFDNIDELAPAEIVDNVIDLEHQLFYENSNSTITKFDVEDNTVFEEEYGVYSGKMEGFWWSFSPSWSMSKTDFNGKSQQFKVSAGIIGKPKTRKVLATKANYTTVFEIIANYLNSLNNLDEDFTMGVGAPLGADQGIPHSMQGCAVPMMRLGEPAPRGKVQPCGPRHAPPPPPHRHPPVPFSFLPVPVLVTKSTSTKKRKKKKRKRKKSKKK